MIHTVLISVILSFFEFKNADYKMHIALLLTELFNERLWLWVKQKLNFFKHKQISVPDATKDYDFNPLFDRLQSYLAVKYVRSIESCELIPKNGDVEFDIKDMTGKKFKDTYVTATTTHEMELHVAEISGASVLDTRQAKRQIVISSKTATPDDIKNYVRKVSNLRLNHTNLIKIYRPIVRGKKKDEQSIEWENVTVRTNKTQENTVYSEEITKELFDDIDTFVSSESWYAQRGIPYKRGYFLHSTPGQGKTSVAKIIANKYGIPIFCLDLTVVNDNSVLTKLMTELNYFVNNEKYILLMEDAERADFFNSRYRDPTLSMDCFLNAIDGVVEPHGRIILMTANDPANIIQHKALMRPGRIDKIMELKPCDNTQLKKLYSLFYSDAKYVVDWDCWKLNEDLSAAYVMKLLQENIGRPEIFLRLIGTKIKSSKPGKKKQPKKDKLLKEDGNTGDNVNDVNDNPGNDDDQDDPDGHDEDLDNDANDDPDDPDDQDDLDEEAMKVIESTKQEQERLDKAQKENEVDRYGRRSRHRPSRSNKSKYCRGGKIESRIKNAKKTIKASERSLKKHMSMVEKTKSKLPALLEKLKEKQEEALRKKLIEKAKKKTAYIKKLEAENKTEEMINMVVDEEEYETPAFLANSIAVDQVAPGTVFTYETTE